MNSQKGHVIVTSLLVLLVLVIMVTSLALLISGETSFLVKEKGEMKAFYTAEAGADYACNILDDNSKWNSTNTPAELKQSERDNINSIISDGSLTSLTKVTSGDTITITSTGESGKQDSTIIISYLISSKSFDYSFVVNGSINMVNNCTITGTAQGGDLYSNDVISYKNNFDTNKQLYENQSIDIIPIIDFAELKSIASDPDNTNATIYTEAEAANFDLSTIGDEFTYIEGDLTVDNNTSISGNGVLVVEGKLTIANHLNINNGSDDNFLIFIKGDGVAEDEDQLIIESGNTTNIKGLIYSNGNIYFKNSLELTGTLMSKGNVDFKNSLDFIFDDSYLDTFEYWDIDIPIGVSGTNEVYKILSWQEE